MVDKKLWRENRRKTEFVCCLVGRKGKKTFVWGPNIFHLGPKNIFSPKWRANREKTLRFAV